MAQTDAAKTAPPALSPRNRGLALRNFAEFQTELFRISAGFIPGLRRWELKREMAELVFRDARRVQDLRTRCRELGAQFSGRHLSRSVTGRELLETLCQAPSAEAGVHAVFLVVKPRLRELLHAYLHDDLRIFDAPSIPVVEECVAELDRQIAWASALPEPEPCPEWLETIRRLAAELDRALEAERGVTEPVQRGRKIGILPILNSVIPDGFRNCAEGTPPVEATEYSGRALYHAHNFLMETQAADSCASLLFDAPDMPWDFYFDVARHLWDETRHCQFGELKLHALGRDIREMGISNTAYVLRQTIEPLDRYAALTTQEADAFPGKHAGLRDALEHGDEVAARAWSYDIVDETQHVRYGHKWIPIMIAETGEPRSYDQVKRDAENWRRDVLGAVYTPTARSFAAAED